MDAQEQDETRVLINSAEDKQKSGYGAAYRGAQNEKVDNVIDVREPVLDENVTVAEPEQEKTGFSICQLPRRKKLSLALLALANVFSGCGFSLLAPFFPKEATKKGVSTTVTGLIFSSFEFVIFLSSPIYGNFMTRIGAKFMFISGIFVGGVCAILFGNLDKCPPGVPFIIMCFACRTIESLGMSAFITAGFAITSNEFPEHVATVFGLLETAAGIGMMVGPAIGGFLYEAGGFGLPFFVIGSLILVNGAVIYKLLPTPHDTSEERKHGMLALFRSPMVLLAMLSILAGGVGLSFLDPTLANHLDKFHLSTSIIGLVFVIIPGLYGLTAPVWGYLSDTKDIQAPLLVIGNLVCGVGYLLVGPSPYLSFLPSELWVVLVGITLFGLCIGCAIVPTMKCLVVGATDVGFENNLDTFGMVSGLSLSTICFGSFLGPTLSGVLIENLGFGKGSTIIGFVFLFVMLFTLAYFMIYKVVGHQRPEMSKAQYQPVDNLIVESFSQSQVQ